MIASLKGLSLVALLAATACSGPNTSSPTPVTPVASSTKLSAQSTVASNPLPTNLRGITYDNISSKCAATKAQLTTLQQLNQPTVRVVFDTGSGAGPACYAPAINSFDQYAYTMGLLLDSSEMKNFSVAQTQARAQNFVSALGSTVSLWEIGNEVNGEWLGSNVPAQISAMYSVVKNAGYKTEMTLYYEPPQTVTPGYDMIPWEENPNNVSAAMHQGLDYVLVSYYETDNNGIRPTQAQWDAIFKQLSADFPNAKVGFGEIGMDRPIHSGSLSKATGIFDYYQTLQFPDIPQYTRAGFWWYAAEDLVPTTKWPTFFSDVQTKL